MRNARAHKIQWSGSTVHSFTVEKMVQLTTEQRVFIVKNYLQTQSSTAVQNAF